MRGLARQVRQAFYGEEALRIQRGRDDVKVMVRYADQQRSSLSGFDEMRIRTDDGREIPIEEVADIAHGRAYSTINRVDRKRTVTVISDIDETTANANQIVADLKVNFLPKLVERYPVVFTLRNFLPIRHLLCHIPKLHVHLDIQEKNKPPNFTIRHTT